MEPKPRHLASEYGAQFADASVVAAYAARPPYPDDVFDVLASLLPPGPQRVLELGCGSGDVTLPLAQRVEHIDALDPAAAMLDHARARAGTTAPNVRWLQTAAESFEPSGRYALAVAAESLHWMNWAVVLPMLARALDDRAVLAIVTTRLFNPLASMEPVGELIARYSTNREYRPYDLIEELSRRALFHELGRRACTLAGFRQNVDDYVESFHSRNGFSRDRMDPGSAAAFDEALRALLRPHAPGGVLTGDVVATIVWGRPLTA